MDPLTATATICEALNNAVKLVPVFFKHTPMGREKKSLEITKKAFENFMDNQAFMAPRVKRDILIQFNLIFEEFEHLKTKNGKLPRVWYSKVANPHNLAKRCTKHAAFIERTSQKARVDAELIKVKKEIASTKPTLADQKEAQVVHELFNRTDATLKALLEQFQLLQLQERDGELQFGSPTGTFASTPTQPFNPTSTMMSTTTGETEYFDTETSSLVENSNTTIGEDDSGNDDTDSGNGESDDDVSVVMIVEVPLGNAFSMDSIQEAAAGIFADNA